MKKRLFSSLLTLCMVLALFPETADATDSPPGAEAMPLEQLFSYNITDNDMLYYRYLEDGIEIADCDTSVVSVIIPEKINGQPVKSVGNDAFRECRRLTSISIPNGVTSIGDQAFYQCVNLTNIFIPNSVTSIGVGAFCDCRSLASILIPDGVTSIGASAFTLCIGLTDVSIPDSVTSIGNGAFSYCSNLTSISIPKSVTFIGAGAFFRSRLTSVTVPGGVKRIGADTNDDLTSSSGCGPFEHCLELTSATLSDGITCIGVDTFRDCSNLANVTIPKSVTSIERGAFDGCENLTDIYYGGSKNDLQSITYLGALPDQWDWTADILNRVTFHYNSTGPGGQGGAGENPKPDVPTPPDTPEYTDESIKNYSLKFHLGTAGEVSMNLQWGWSLFSAASNSYNIPLSAAAMMLSASAEHSEEEVKSLLYSLGFKTTDSKNYGHSWMEVDHPGVAFGYQEVNGKHIFAIVVRGTSSDEVEDFVSDALGFVPSANNLRLQWESFVTDVCKLNLSDIKDNSRFLVTGHSLGGATANVLAKNLNDTYGEKNVYTYAFAPPKPVDFLTGAINAGAHNNIFNVVNVEDGVTYLPPDGFLFTRYGRDIPFHRDRNDGFYAKFKELTGRDFNKGFLGLGADSAHDTAVYMAYVLTGQLSDTIRVIKCACPVDVEVYDSSGTLVGQVRNNEVINTESEKVYIRVVEDEKYIYVLADDDYTINMIGTDEGTMTYSVQDIDGTGEVVAEKVYQDVKLNSGKLLSSTVADISVASPSNALLYVVDENGDPEKEVLPDGNGTEVPIDTPDNPSTPYTITFDASGGAVSPTSLTTDTGGKLSSLPTPTRSNYSFNGWYKLDGAKVTTDTAFTADTTVYARWTYIGSSNVNSPSSNPSSSDNYTPPTYSIIAPSITGGTVSIAPKSASKGTVVTITATPNADYELVSLVVSDKDGKKVELTDKGNGKYTFTMPDGKVSVDAVFQPIQVPETPWSNPFTDIVEGSWYYDAVKFVNENGLMNGYGDNRFCPDDNLSRAMLAQILYNKENRPATTSLAPFSDVASDAWYSDAVAWAAQQGIVTGYGNGLFGPGDNITREQLAVMLWRYSGEPAATNKELRFSDADSASDYALDTLRWAVENGIINGYGNGILDPKGLATRAQVAQMLMNYLKK